MYRSRTPQPPAEDEEENIDDTLVTIDTCKYKYKDKMLLCQVLITCEKIAALVVDPLTVNWPASIVQKFTMIISLT